MIQPIEQVLQALEAAQEQQPDQAAWLAFHRELLEVQWAVERRLPPLVTPIARERVEARREARQPLFTFDELEVKWAVAEELAHQVEELAAHKLPDWPAEPAVEVSVARARAWYAGESRPPPREAFLLRESLRPFLHRAASMARPHVSAEAYHRWGRCPVCGGEPDFATLDRETGARWLHCQRCDTGWRYKRVGCPFCDTEDPYQLAYFPSEDGVYRLYVCETCRRYVKTMDLRQTGQSFLLPMERVLTVGMDLAAAEAGYGG